MQIEIKYSPSYSMAFATLSAGETIKAEAGAMVSQTPGLQMETKADGGIMKGLKRSFLGGESFFMNTFTATQEGDQIGLAPPLPGDMAHWPLAGQTVYLQSGSYVASSAGVEVDTDWGGAKTFFSGEGLIVLKVSGTGDLVLSSYGAIHSMDLAAGQSYIVDTGHMVGWSDGVQYEVHQVRWRLEEHAARRRGPDLQAHRPRAHLPADPQPRGLHRLARAPAAQALQQQQLTRGRRSTTSGR